MTTGRLGVGVPGTLDPSLIRDIGQRAERAGLATLWVNEIPHGDSLAGLAAAAGATGSLTLATGVIPLDRFSPEQIARKVGALALPTERLILGVGSGGDRAHPIRLVRDGLRELRALVACPLVVGALGPQMRHLAAIGADGLLMNWLDPASAKAAAVEFHRDAEAAGKTGSRLAVYVRVSVGEPAGAKLREEAAFYERIPGYKANFARLGITAMDAAIAATSVDDLRARLRPYLSAADEVVARLITANGQRDEFLALVDAIAPLVAPPERAQTGA